MGLLQLTELEERSGGSLLLVSFSFCFPAVGKELIDLRDWCCRQASENIFEIFETVYVQSAAGLYESHENGSGLSAIGRAHEKPIVSS